MQRRPFVHNKWIRNTLYGDAVSAVCPLFRFPLCPPSPNKRPLRNAADEPCYMLCLLRHEAGATAPTHMRSWWLVQFSGNDPPPTTIPWQRDSPMYISLIRDSICTGWGVNRP